MLKFKSALNFTRLSLNSVVHCDSLVKWRASMFQAKLAGEQS